MYRIAMTLICALLLSLAGTGAALAMSHEEGDKSMEGDESMESSESMEESGEGMAEADESMAEADEGETMSSGPKGEIARAVVTSEVVDREPVEDLGDSVSTDISRVFFFTEIRDAKGGTITHRWEHDGEVKAEVDFDVGGDRWRVWSSKQMVEGWTGQWRISVVNQNGTILDTTTFDYVPAEDGDDDMSGDSGMEDEGEMSGEAGMEEEEMSDDGGSP